MSRTILDKARLRAIVRQRCPVCLEGPMFSGLFTMNPLGLGVFFVLALVANAALGPRLGVGPALLTAVAFYLPSVPVLFRYARVIWAHVNIGTIPRAEWQRERHRH